MIEETEDPLATVTDSAITDETLALSVYSHSSFKIMVFNFDGTTFMRQHIFNVEGEVTALSVNSLPAGVCVLAGLSQRDLPTLAIFPIGSPQSEAQVLIDIPRGKIPLSTRLRLLLVLVCVINMNNSF
jgi:hypothetical protein